MLRATVPNTVEYKIGAHRLVELCDIKPGYAFEGDFFSNTGEYVLLTPVSFCESGGYRDRGAKQKFYTGQIPRAYILSEGDLLVAMTEQAAGLLGSPWLVPESHKFLHTNQDRRSCGRLSYLAD